MIFKHSIILKYCFMIIFKIIVSINMYHSRILLNKSYKITFIANQPCFALQKLALEIKILFSNNKKHKYFIEAAEDLLIVKISVHIIYYLNLT